jgi:integral membrane protein (TIGR01906 family)
MRKAIRDGAALLVGGALLTAAAFTIAFDATFTFFHGLFFAAGTWTFDPAKDRLVLLYPESFWILAALLFCLALASISLISFRLSGRR